MKTSKLIAALLCVSTIVACKSEKKEDTKQEVQQEQKVEDAPKTYAEISVAQGGEWKDGPRGHQEYSNGTSFKNVNRLKVPAQHTDQLALIPLYRSFYQKCQWHFSNLNKVCNLLCCSPNLDLRNG